MGLLSGLIKLVVLPARIIEEAVEHSVTGHGTRSRNDRPLTGGVEDIADEVDDFEESIIKAIKEIGGDK